MEKLNIKFTDYEYPCGDGCCLDYGILTEINGETLDLRNTDMETQVRQILEHLGYEVNIETIYDRDQR